MAQERLLRFKVPEVGDVDVYLVRLPDGRIVARTKDELEEIKQQGPEKTGERSEK